MKSDTLPIFSTKNVPRPSGWPLLRLGFRPFYLGGALAAALWVPLWLAIFFGVLRLPTAVPGLLWHAHEMLYGFAVAIIVGFLMTAGKNWTGLQTPRGAVLGALALLWLAARLAGLSSATGLFALLDLALLPAVATIFATLLLRARNFRNLPLALILLLLAAANAVFHLSQLGVLEVDALQSLHAALSLITLVECVIAGRVIPAFTMAANPGARLTARPLVEWLALGLTAAALLFWVLQLPGTLVALALLGAACAQAWRLARWRSKLAWGKPILWILHLAYCWIVLGLALLGLAQLDLLAPSAGVHALGLGATGGLIIGMITRTARGHTGRALQLTRVEVAAYLAVLLAAVMRVAAAVLPAALFAPLLIAAAGLWSMAFVLYLWKYTPWLLATRLDGKDG